MNDVEGEYSIHISPLAWIEEGLQEAVQLLENPVSGTLKAYGIGPFSLFPLPINPRTLKF
jgi:hypothetical protein